MISIMELTKDIEELKLSAYDKDKRVHAEKDLVTLRLRLCLKIRH